MRAELGENWSASQTGMERKLFKQASKLPDIIPPCRQQIFVRRNWYMHFFFPGKAAFSVDNFFLKFDFQQVWNFSIWFPDQKRKRSGKRPLRYWGVVSEISQNVQISYFLILFPNEKISISFPLNCYMFNKLDHKSHPTFLFNFLEAHEIFG